MCAERRPRPAARAVYPNLKAKLMLTRPISLAIIAEGKKAISGAIECETGKHLLFRKSTYFGTKSLKPCGIHTCEYGG